MRQLLTLILLLVAAPAFGQATYKGRTYYSRQCNNANCRMCAIIEAQLTSKTVQASGHWETRRVKRCNGRSCWFESQRVWVPASSTVQPTQSSHPATGAVEAPLPDATPEAKVQEALDAIGLKPGEYFIDLGCGDGRYIEAAVKRGAYGLGLELDDEAFKRACSRLSKSCSAGGYTLRKEDVTAYDLSQADVVAVYQFPDVLADIRWDTLKTGARVISYQHDIPGYNTVKHGEFYVYTVTPPVFEATPSLASSTLLSSR